MAMNSSVALWTRGSAIDSPRNNHFTISGLVLTFRECPSCDDDGTYKAARLYDIVVNQWIRTRFRSCISAAGNTTLSD
jgi:hypothetical protein